MTITAADVMRRVRNYFITSSVTRQWRSQGSALYPKGVIAPGTWIAIDGAGPRGVYRLDENGCALGLPDKQWIGTVHVLTPPAEFLRLCQDISDYAASHDPSLTSEKFGEYSCARGDSCGWAQVFTPALAPYMRMYPEVEV